MANEYLREFWRSFWPFAVGAAVLFVAALVWAIITDLRFAWGLVSAIVSMSIGGWLGWDMRRSWQRHIEFRNAAPEEALDLLNDARRLVVKISTFTDPLDSVNVVEELECWSSIVSEAKAIAGDNAPDPEELH
jgi:hypothetical protein